MSERASTAGAYGPISTYLKARTDDMAWWRHAKFGMFIHWGPAALCGGDISWCRLGPERLGDHQFVAEPRVPSVEYDNLYRNFNPVLFDPREWVAIAQAAGMKYIVLVAKHHDGFCLFDSKLTRHKSTAPDCPCQRDIVAEFAEACHEADMKMGLYYSARDWYHPDYLTERHDRYLAYYHGQVAELLCNYGKVDILWFDHIGGSHEMWDADLIYRMARTLQPGILINNRMTLSVFHGQLAGYEGDFDTPEQEVGRYNCDRAWESCLCLVGGVWSYKPDGRMMTLEECVHALLGCIGGDGNLLLNTGPMPDGRIEPRQADRLLEVGCWLKAVGKTVYGTRGGPIPPGEGGVCTSDQGRMYLHVTRWPADVDEPYRISLSPGGSREHLNHSALTAQTLSGAPASVAVSEAYLEVYVAPQDRTLIDTVVVIT